MLKFRATAGSGWKVDQPLETMKFPAGEVHIKTSADDEIYTPELAVWIAEHDKLNDDLVTLAMYADYVRQRGMEPKLYVPYFPGARQDRGAPFGAKVYADLVNTMGFSEVTILAPHSPTIVGLIKNVRVLDATHVLVRSIFGRAEMVDSSWAGIIAPDAGAVERASRVAKATGLPLFKAEKHRDFETGKLSGFSCEPVPSEGRLLVVDDCCNQGGTFSGLADAIGVSRDRLALWVTHGGFSGHAEKLREHFGAIYTTDSHVEARREDMAAQVFSTLPYLTYGPFVPLENFAPVEVNSDQPTLFD